MGNESSCAALGLKVWKTQIERADKLFGTLSSEEVLREIAPGRNRLLYLWHPIGSTFEQDVMLAFDDLKAADAAPDRDANARRVLRTDLKAARGDRHRRGGQRESNEPAA